MAQSPRPNEPFDIRTWRGAIVIAIAMIVGGVIWSLLLNDGDVDAGTIIAVAIGGFVGWLLWSVLARRARP